MRLKIKRITIVNNNILKWYKVSSCRKRRRTSGSERNTSENSYLINYYICIGLVYVLRSNLIAQMFQK